MKQNILLLVATVTLVSMALGKTSLGKCPTPALKSPFDATKYIGTWYEIARDKSFIFENGNC